MKKYLLFIAVLVLAGCTDQLGVENVADVSVEQAADSEVKVLIEKARWGDADAYMKLADCYRDGVGVEPDFMNMLCMLAMADEYGKETSEEDYMRQIPDGHEFRMLFDAVDLVYRAEHEKANQIADEMIGQGVADGYSVKGISLLEQGDTLNGKTYVQRAAEKGSTLASLLLASRLDWKDLENIDVDRMVALSEDWPTANYLLTRWCLEGTQRNKIDDAQIAHYLVKADKNGMLSRRAAGWLLSYHEHGGSTALTDEDVERLKLLSGAYLDDNTDDTVLHADKELESNVRNILEESSYIEWNSGSVYVVETQTGRIKAHVGLEKRGNGFAPFEDTFADEQMVMMTGPSYLALLMTGKVTPETIYDTGAGIYKDVRDHNWRRGGYGNICLERALEVRSQIAFTMAKEQVFGNCTEEFDEEMNVYLHGMKDSPFGLLTFYNAIANNGRMVLPVYEGDDVVVLDEQIAPIEHVKTLQNGLRKCVSEGLMRKCGRDYVNVAACGRTFFKEGNTRRMELCGYFPAENPQYTIMVILEKEGLPASAGGMCGPIFAKTVDLLVDEYRLESMLTRQFEDWNEVVEVSDSIQ